MRITKIEPIGKKPVYDISVKDKEHYVLENGVVTHNTGIYLSADNIWIIGRQQEKDGKEISGYHFIINIEKSRHVREKTKIPITVLYDGGIGKWSGLREMGEKFGYIVKPKVGWYQVIDADTGEVLFDKSYRAKELDASAEVWNKLFKETNFATAISEHYKVAGSSIIEEDEDLSALTEDIDG